jgi:cell division protein FtsB
MSSPSKERRLRIIANGNSGDKSRVKSQSKEKLYSNNIRKNKPNIKQSPLHNFNPNYSQADFGSKFSLLAESNENGQQIIEEYGSDQALINSPSLIYIPAKKIHHKRNISEKITSNHLNPLAYSFGKRNSNSKFNTHSQISQQTSACATLKLKEELSELKLKNEKLVHEIKLLNEKLKNSKNAIQFTEKKGDLIKGKYQEIIEAYKKEIESLRKLVKGGKFMGMGNNMNSNLNIFNNNNQITDSSKKELSNSNSNSLSSPRKAEKTFNFKLEEKLKQAKTYLISTLNIMIEIIEMFLQQKPPNTHRDSVLLKTQTENISYSIDIYDSYNNDDERRNTYIEQIQSVIISKIKFLQSIFEISLEKEISRVKNWSNLMLNKADNSNTNISLSNLSNVKFSMKKDSNKEKDLSNASSEQNQSNAFHSPKFYRNISFDSLKGDTDLKIKVFEIGKDENYSVGLNDSSSKMDPGDSFNFVINDADEGNGNFQHLNTFNDSFRNDGKKIFTPSVRSFGCNGNVIEGKENTSFTGNNYILGVNNTQEDEEVEKINITCNNTNIPINNQNNGKETNDPIVEKEITNEDIITPTLKFTSTFKKLSIDLNDEPTDFNIEQFYLNKGVKVNKPIEQPVKNEMEEQNTQDIDNINMNNPVILSPIVANNKDNNISFTDY